MLVTQKHTLPHQQPATLQYTSSSLILTPEIATIPLLLWWITNQYLSMYNLYNLKSSGIFLDVRSGCNVLWKGGICALEREMLKTGIIPLRGMNMLPSAFLQLEHPFSGCLDNTDHSSSMHRISNSFNYPICCWKPLYRNHQAIWAGSKPFYWWLLAIW